MEPNLYQGDLAFLYEKLLQHPLFVIQPDRLSEFQTLYQTMPRPDSFPAFAGCGNRLTGFFHDGHTNLEIPYTASDRCIHIPCIWVDKGLTLSEDFRGIPAGSQLLWVEQMPLPEITARMGEQIPHENEYLVKSRMVRYPYRNYHLFSDLNLAALFGPKEHYEITFCVNGTPVSQRFSMEPYNGFLDFKSDDEFLSYEFSEDTATLHLDACICNDTYCQGLDTLARLCTEKNIQTLILDLSENMGGSSAVIDRFLEHVNIETFHRYEMIDYSNGKEEFITRRDETVPNRKSPFLFPANILCRVSHNTFSSARTFAVTLKDNGIASIIGSPAGGKPSSFGLPKKYRMPHTAIRFRVSTSLFLRPNRKLDSEIALFPDR